MNEWLGNDGMLHRGFIDKDDPYMALRAEDYPGNSSNLTLFNFKRDKVTAYERAQNAISQGLVIFPSSLNVRGELEIEEKDANGDSFIKYEKVDKKDLDVYVQMDLLKEELVGMQKIERNKNIFFELSAESKSKGLHDDRVDCAVMILNRLMEIRAEEALETTKKSSDFSKIFNRSKEVKKKSNNPFDKLGTNPFKKSTPDRFR